MSTPGPAPSGGMSVGGRLERLRASLEQAHCQALLVTALANVRYLTGFTGSAAMLLVGPDASLLVTDGRYRTQALEQLESSGATSALELVVGRVPDQRRALTDTLAGWPIGRLGLEAESVSWGAKQRWAEALPDLVLVATSGVVEELRQVKDEAELSRMAFAAALADAALEEVRPLLEAGHSEAELALSLDGVMRRLGAEDRAFETIVASGPNAAKPHASPTDRQLRPGDPVVVDFGALYDGYRSDMTRTFFVGERATGPMADVLEVVTRAQAEGLRAVRAGAVTGAVDDACRRLITDAGFGPAFEHSTGHGVGLDIHEAPWVGKDATAILEAGSVVTVEPGIYLAGLGGVRIEDTVVVTEEGCRVLTRFPKDVVA